jgi:hypothetical protein
MERKGMGGNMIFSCWMMGATLQITRKEHVLQSHQTIVAKGLKALSHEAPVAR